MTTVYDLLPVGLENDEVLLCPCGASWTHHNFKHCNENGDIGIEFKCECCERRSLLILLQHEGQTFIGWKFER